ncbi:MAG: peptidoglycan-binding protein [Clostridia bacterium]|nr:peptidoglycan-binding protein [Clostridia bacterium]
MAILPFVPEFITVHLGRPDEYAENITVSFPEYIKNVASSELYPTWPQSALRANILAQISYALNRVYTEFYRASGYDFDITSSPSVDQSFVRGRDIFENVSEIVDEIFNDYIVRQGNIEPLFAQYCNGTTTVCDGLSQWGSVTRANEGLVPYEILQYYYGDDINIVENAPISNIEPSNPLNPLRLGSIGEDVRQIQLKLNRISKNYPSIPKITPVSGFFTESTENAVKEFQRIFDLAVDGIVGKATWYKIQFLYNGVKRLNELASEGIVYDEIKKQFPDVLRQGDTGDYVSILQYYLRVIGDYYSAVPIIEITGVYDDATVNAVKAFQGIFGLVPDGITGELTWGAVFDAYYGIINSLPNDLVASPQAPFSGNYLALGSTGEEVSRVQEYLNVIATVYPSISPPLQTGVYSSATEEAVKEFQRLFDLTDTGIIDPITWDELTDQYTQITESGKRSEGQYASNTASQNT